MAPTEVSKVSDRLEDEHLAGRRAEDDAAPFVVVIRERDFDRMKEPVGKHAEEFTKLIVDNWRISSPWRTRWRGAKGIPEAAMMYETVVSGILLGGLMDAFYEDKTLMPPPPRRGKTDRYFGWLALASSGRREV